LLLVICVAVQAQSMVEPQFAVLEAQAMSEVANAMNHDLLEGHGLEDHGSVALLENQEESVTATETETEAATETETETETESETATEAETETATEVVAEAEAETETETEVEAPEATATESESESTETAAEEATTETTAETAAEPVVAQSLAESQSQTAYYDHYVDDIENDKFKAANATVVRPDVMDNAPEPTAENAAANKYSQANPSTNASAVSNNPTDIRSREATSLPNNSSKSWEKRRRYSYTDADMDAIDEVDADETDPEGDLKRILADPNIEIYDTDEDKGVYFGPTKKDASTRQIKLRKAMTNSIRDARLQYELREKAKQQALYPAGHNGTLALNATAVSATVPAAAAPHAYFL